MRNSDPWLTAAAWIAAAWLLAGPGCRPLAAQQGWCCKDGVVTAATPDQCREKGGSWFFTQAEAEKFCQENAPGFCCLDGLVVAATRQECTSRKGAWFASRDEAESSCQNPEWLPDLVIKGIEVDRKCQVVVIVANAGPGPVPDDVWVTHKPISSSVVIFINGRKRGGRTIWGFDPGRLLQPAGGTAKYVSDLKVSGLVEISAVVDLTGEVGEAREDNNELVRKVRCSSGRGQ
jgi:hypothetical protein